MKWAWEDSNTPPNPQENGHSEKSAAECAAQRAADQAARHASIWSPRRRARVIKAARIIERGARLAGWTIRRRSVAASGSTYLKLRRADGMKVRVRVADHWSKAWAKPTEGNYDTRTQPRDLLRCLRWLRNFQPTTPQEVQHADART